MPTLVDATDMVKWNKVTNSNFFNKVNDLACIEKSVKCKITYKIKYLGEVMKVFYHEYT